jgi:hypothetical protein
MAMALGLVSATVAGTIDPAVWPAPASGNPTSEAWASIASTFDIVLPTSVGADTVLGRSAGRYKSKIAALTNTANGVNESTGGSATASVSTLTVMVDDATSLTPFTFPVDESYNLSLVAGGSSVELRAATQWGAPAMRRLHHRRRGGGTPEPAQHPRSPAVSLAGCDDGSCPTLVSPLGSPRGSSAVFFQQLHRRSSSLSHPHPRCAVVALARSAATRSSSS